MDFQDHSRNHPPATRASFISGIPKIHHNACGGRVWDREIGGEQVYVCSNCSQRWKSDVILNFDNDAIAVRFHLRGDIDTEAYVIVWKVDPLSNKMYSTEVRATSPEARKWERFKL